MSKKEDRSIPRREFLRLASAALAVGPCVLATSQALADGNGQGRGQGKRKKEAAQPAAPVKGLLRIGCVSTAVEGGVLPPLVDAFKAARTSVEVRLTKDDEPYEPAKEGKYDLVISHFGHKDTERFILDGFGEWPHMVFSNQLCLVGPLADPAGIRGTTDLAAAFAKIAGKGAPYVVNRTKGIGYLTEILWNATGRPVRGSWYIDPGSSKKAAIELAAEKQAYVLWGLTPFLREKTASHGALVPMVTADPLLQRVMVTVVLRPEATTGVNRAAAAAFQDFLLLPATQAKILRTHYPGADQAVWAPCGRHNAGNLLPEAT